MALGSSANLGGVPLGGGHDWSYYQPSTGVVDAYGNPVPSTQYSYIARINYNSAIAGSPMPAGVPVYAVNPNYNSNSVGSNSLSSSVSPTPPPVQSTFTFDTIGQTIVRSIGHCRLPLRYIWVKGVTA